MASEAAKYESVGTIRYEDDKWFFVPDANYCVEHYGKKYAIFLRQAGEEYEAISRNLPESGVGVRLNGQVPEPFMFGAQSAAMSQSKVMVMVADNGIGNDPSLRGISVPPPK